MGQGCSTEASAWSHWPLYRGHVTHGAYQTVTVSRRGFKPSCCMTLTELFSHLRSGDWTSSPRTPGDLEGTQPPPQATLSSQQPQAAWLRPPGSSELHFCRIGRGTLERAASHLSQCCLASLPPWPPRSQSRGLSRCCPGLPHTSRRPSAGHVLADPGDTSLAPRIAWASGPGAGAGGRRGCSLGRTASGPGLELRTPLAHVSLGFAQTVGLGALSGWWTPGAGRGWARRGWGSLVSSICHSRAVAFIINRYH